ncbi:MAG: ABC transporter permease [Bacteroidales bacterium]|nr:ABC transporter permease [Bacteroidales bacterium]
MSGERFISRKLRFRGGVTVASVAVSFLVMILAVCISAGFRSSIRSGVRSIIGDVRIMPQAYSFSGEAEPMTVPLPSGEAILAIPGVAGMEPVVERAGIVRNGDIIHGVLVKGCSQAPDSSLCVSIPERLSAITGLGVGDDMPTYFVGEKVKVRKFHITAVHRDIMEMDNNLLVYAPLEDMRRLQGWDENQASAVDITLSPAVTADAAVNDISGHIGTILLTSTHEEEEDLVAFSSIHRYAQVFDWLRLLDFNVVVILILMTVVAGFNMLAGVLIHLLRNIPIIGTLKTMGMADRSIVRVFLRVSSRAVLLGMAIGNALALLFCAVQGSTHLIRLDPANYFVSFVPVHVNLLLIIGADIIAYLAMMAMLMLSVKFISRVDPAQTVKAD